MGLDEIVNSFFQKIDRNGDGVLSREEIREFFEFAGKAHHKHYTPEEVDAAFAVADANQNGMLERSELLAFLQNIKK